MTRGRGMFIIGLSLVATLVAMTGPRAAAHAESLGQCNYSGSAYDFNNCYYDDPWAEWPYVSCSWTTDMSDCRELAWQGCGGGPGNWEVDYASCIDSPTLGQCDYLFPYGFALQYIECRVRYVP